MKILIPGLNLDLKNLIPGLNLNWAKKQWLTEKKVQNLGLTAESCRKPKTNNQQLLRNKLKLALKYELNIRFETQIWKPGADLKMKNLEMRSWIPGLDLEKICSKPGKSHFLVYFNKSLSKRIKEFSGCMQLLAAS